MLDTATTHDLSHSSQPTGSEPTFQPVATGRAKTSDEALDRLAAEAIDLAAREDATYDLLAGLPSDDPEQVALTAEAKRLEENVKGRLSMAALVRADTLAGLAAKGRAVLAYRRTLDGCVVDEAQPLLISMAEDAVHLASLSPSVQDDATLLSLGRYFEAQWRQERIVIERNGSDEAIKIETDRSEDFVKRIRDLPATTPAGWHVKARAIAWTCSGDLSGECPPDVAMVASLLRDLGAIEGGSPSAPKLPDPDRYLLAFKAPFDKAWAAQTEVRNRLDASGSDEDFEAHSVASDATSAVVRNIESFPATSLEGLKLKAAALSALYPGEEITAEHIEGSKEAPSTDIRLIVQIIRDLRAMVDEPVVSIPPQLGNVAETLEQAA